MSSTEVIEESEPNAWWTTLKHEGVLLSPPVLEDTFPDGPPEIREPEIDKLRRNHRNFRSNPDQLRDWLDTVFQDLLEHTSSWEKEHLVSDEHTYQDLKPNRVLVDEDNDPRLAVWIDDDRVTDDDGEPGRIGIYSGRRTYADLVKLLRNTEIPIGILTNGHQFRVVNATLDRESWTEWDTEAWFEGGEGRDSLQGFYGLLSDEVLASPAEDEEDSLIDKIEESQDRQADLSDVMGTQVRESVEMLLQELDSVLMEVDEETREEILAPLKKRDIKRQEELRARYQASIRIIMRLVVALYAESRELFPKENPVYYDSYSVEGLFRELREAKIEESEEALKKQYGAWPRLQSLSRLIYHGSPHPDIPMQSYGGRLFRPPSEDGEDDVLAGIEVFEHDEVRITDATILEILENLKIAEFRSGGSRRRGPVDFSDLRTEYIGMMYEGLLEYDLREAKEDDGAIVFLELGDNPALPFNVLEDLDDEAIENLVKNLKDDSSGNFLSGEEVSESDFEEENEQKTEEKTSEKEFGNDLEARVFRWSKRVVEQTGVYMPHHNTVRAMDPTTQEKYEIEAAKRVVDRVIRPGGTYLVNYGGDRKSTGTFYTRPELAVPTVRRTLEPQVYDKTEGKKRPKTPEEILSLQVCDPAMGSGTFPVAALNYLTEVLKESFEEYVFPELEKGDRLATPLGETAKGYLNERLLDIRKDEDEDWQSKLEIQLKRSVVERCIYGVDINPLAVELGKLSLWIETLDPKLPFTFLDHKLKVGNSLVGTWIQEYDEYPIGAWERGGGDGRTGENTKKIKNIRKKKVEEKAEILKRKQENQTHWFESDEGNEVRNNLAQAYNDLHSVISEAERGDKYQQEIVDNEDYSRLKTRMDRWCALWFWPIEKLDSAPLPDEWDDFPSEEEQKIIDQVKSDFNLRFFHWEIEFPDVFSDENPGFDVVAGNPPWEIVKPQSREWFQQYIPHARALKRREFNSRKRELLESHSEIRRRWKEYRAKIKARKHWIKNVGKPQSIIGSDTSSVRDFSAHGKGNVQLSKSFMVQALNLGDNVGMLLPSSIRFAQRGAKLREACSRRGLSWVATIENRSQNGRKAFDADFDRFSILICDEGNDVVKITRPILNFQNWADSEIDTTIVGDQFISEFSPELNSFPPLYNRESAQTILKICQDKKRIYNSVEDGVLELEREYHSTDDANKFVSIDASEEDFTYHIVQDEYLPVIEGKDFYLGVTQAQVTSGEWPSDFPASNDWVPIDEYRESHGDIENIRLVFRNTGNCQMERSFCPGLLPNWPMVNSATRAKMSGATIESKLELAGVMQSHIFDYVFRRRIDANHNNCFVREQPLPDLTENAKKMLSSLMCSLAFSDEMYIPYRYYLNSVNTEITRIPIPASEEAEDVLRANCEAIVAEGYGLSKEDLEIVLRETEDPRSFRLVDDELKEKCIAAYECLDENGTNQFTQKPWKIPSSGNHSKDWTSPPDNRELEATTSRILSEDQMKALQQSVEHESKSFRPVWESLIDDGH